MLHSLTLLTNDETDISMPVMDGLEATRKMRHFERTNGLARAPIIILTAALSADMQQEATRSGVDRFLTKPTPLKQLKQLLQNLPQPQLSNGDDT